MTKLALAVKHNSWLVLVAACMTVLAIQLITLRIDPTLFQDEMQIVDHGRTSLDPGSDWGMTWNVQRAIPVLSPSYLSSAVQELAFRTSQSNMGPRIASMMAAMVATFCLFGWLSARETPKPIALLLALAFLLDPIFSDTYRQGRVDAYAIAACLAACWLLRSAGGSEALGQPGRAQLFTAGTLVAVSPFFWLAVPLLFPLVILEIFSVAAIRRKRSPGTAFLKQATPVFKPFIAGLLGGGLVCSIPFLLNWENYWQGMVSAVAVQQRAAVIQNPMVDLFLVHDPILALTVGVSLLLRRDIGLLAALAFAVALIFQTMIYLPRLVYLLPYLLAMVAAAGSADFDEDRPSLVRGLVRPALACLLLWNAGLILLVRPYAALQQWPANDPEQFRAELEHQVGSGEYRVLLEAWEAYYAGRALGWKNYHVGSPVSTSDYLDFVSTMDFVVLSEHHSYRQVSRRQLEEAGFDLIASIEPAHSEKTRIGWGRLSWRQQNAAYSVLLIYRRMGQGNRR